MTGVTEKNSKNQVEGVENPITPWKGCHKRGLLGNY